MTNYEHIKNMTVDEMSEFISCPYLYDLDECKFGWHAATETCEECKKKWLESEVS